LPRGRSAEIVPGLLAAGARAVIDLGGDFRLAAEDYPPWYGFEHPAPGLLAEAVYGLPEIFGSLIPGARLVANPGCFPTAALLGLVPLLHAGVLSDEHPIHVDGKTGTSGAGREAGETGSLATSQDSIRPYRVDAHQHTPEIERGLALATGRQVRVTFVPHLVPAVRGVMTTSYGRLAAPSPTEATSEVLTEILVEAYRDRPFVRVLPSHVPIDTKRTRAANVIELQVVAHPRSATAVVLAGIDNLVKGAAGQAIQNANLLFGLPETTGLPTTGVWP
jgi:N-acetyl-gamma-glutamyl-phosphate reductase